MKFLIKAVLALVLVLALLVGGLVVYVTLGEYKPGAVLPMQINKQRESMVAADELLSMTTFNIGYAGLDRDTDFFFDGGTMSRAISKQRVESNLAGILEFLSAIDSDFYLLQEVDENSSRSYGVNQVKTISAAFEYHSTSFAPNYQVAWVPLPFTRPMGRVQSGLVTLSNYIVTDATRRSLPGEFSWPMRVFELDRCILESRLPVTNGKELVIAHIHLAAYDKGGFIRNQQVAFLQTYAREEYEKGNYVVLGGDWNHLLAANPEEKRARLSATWPDWLQLLPKNYLTEFNWAFDESVPTNRTIEAPYDPKTTFVSNIDGFLLSPNIEIISVSGHDLGFRFSDHNPVTVQFRLQPDPDALVEN